MYIHKEVYKKQKGRGRQHWQGSWAPPMSEEDRMGRDADFFLCLKETLDFRVQKIQIINCAFITDLSHYY